MTFGVTSCALLTTFSSASSESFVCLCPQLSRAVISGQLSPVSDGDTIGAVSLPVSDRIPVVALCPLTGLCSSVPIPFNISAFLASEFGDGWLLHEFLPSSSFACNRCSTGCSWDFCFHRIDGVSILICRTPIHSATVSVRGAMHTLGSLLSLSHQISCRTGDIISPQLS